jgi:hypothetical protein
MTCCDLTFHLQNDINLFANFLTRNKEQEEPFITVQSVCGIYDMQTENEI